MARLYQQLFKVLSGELDDVVWVVDEDLFRKVLEDGWEGRRDHQLGGGEDAHLSNVCHLLLFFIIN
jgi:hypothetical protein